MNISQRYIGFIFDISAPVEAESELLQKIVHYVLIKGFRRTVKWASLCDDIKQYSVTNRFQLPAIPIRSISMAINLLRYGYFLSVNNCVSCIY